ncbi:ABC transporter permease [Parvularcula marina]|uniref:Transport permease protein n=1 Tax=Parvularcula marina TaxID=2292771 RepID=A0A371RK13_9PROT|nr:ABC transporter permease [Parvularcula marina]RFB05792.1 multidrug ABC transporter permease [Parvularcula marina]
MSEALTKSAAGPDTLGVRPFGRVNWIGLWTLYRKEVRRFMKVAFQTVFAPIITTLLYLTVFLVAFSGSDRNPVMAGQVVAYAAFLPPGLIMMAILSNAFQNSSSSLIIAKVQGTVVDVLMPPLSAAELTVAFVAGAATRGLLVGLVTALTIAGFMAFTHSPFQIQSLAAILYFSIAASLILGAVGAIAGMWAEKFDQLALISNFVITPLTFLSGTFYSVNKEGLPDWVPGVSAFNPLFYLIDGFRYGFIGVSDAPVMRGALISLVLTVGLIFITYRLFRSGYKLKA